MGQYDSAIQLLIKAQDQTGPAFASLQGNLRKTEQSSTGAAFATSIFSGVAVAGLTVELQKAARIANENEASIGRLSTAVNNNGGSWARNSRQVLSAIEANRRFGFSDNELADSLNVLTIQSGSWEEALRRQGLAMDFARATGMDLLSASRLLGKVTDENAMGLKRWGIEVEKGATTEELLAKVQARTANAAEDATKRADVRSQILKNHIDDIYGAVGANVTWMSSFATIGNALPTFFGGATAAVSFFTKTTGVGAAAATNFSRTLSGLGGAAMSLGRILGPAGLVVGGVYATVNALHALFKNVAAPGSEGEKIAKTMDQFAAISEKHGGGIGGFFGTLKDIYLETNADTVLGRFLKEQDAAKTKQNALTEATKATVSMYRELTKGQQEFLDKMGGPGGQVTAKPDPQKALTALATAFGGEEKVPESLKKTISGIATNTLGLAGQALRTEVGDQLYKLVEESMSPVVRDLAEQIKTFKEDPKALAQAALAASKTTEEYMRVLTERHKRARDEMAILMEQVGEAIKAQDLTAPDAKADAALSAKIRKVHEARDAVAEIEPLHNKDLLKMLEINRAWDDAIIGAKTYGYVLSQMPSPPRPRGWHVDSDGYAVPGPAPGNSPLEGTPSERALGGAMWPGNVYTLGEQNRREAVVMGVGSDRSRDPSGGVTIAPGAISLNYSGPADKPAAARLGADIVDTVTEALRQQTRRVGRRPSPFGAV